MARFTMIDFWLEAFQLRNSYTLLHRFVQNTVASLNCGVAICYEITKFLSLSSDRIIWLTRNLNYTNGKG